MPGRLLIIDDDHDMCLLLQRFLEKNGFEVMVHHKGQKGIAAYQASKFDAVICDYRLGDMDGIHVIKTIRQADAAAVIIVITGYSNTRVAVEVMKLGARDYITKPLVPDELLAVLKQALTAPVSSAHTTPSAAGREQAQGIPPPATVTEFYTKTKSPVMQEVYRMIDVVAPTNYNVILYGESGTGKEVVARMIHEKSLRRNKPFVAVDCGILSRELSGSELFGHVKGAFTGALYDREGHFATANGGTLFLDEVANLPPEVQTTLLRVIQERRFRPVGSGREQPADVRVVVASNESLIDAHQKGRFREDLYYRFNEFMLSLPPLRERKEDIIPLAQLFMQKAGEETGNKPAGFERNVYSFLRGYSWPGNLRELKNIIRRAVLLTPPDQLISLEAFPPELWNTENAEETARKTISADGQPQAVADSSLQEELAFDDQEDITTVYDRLKGAANKAEYQAILQALKKANFNKKKAAAILNIDRKTLYNKLKNFRLRYSY